MQQREKGRRSSCAAVLLRAPLMLLPLVLVPLLVTLTLLASLHGPTRDAGQGGAPEPLHARARADLQPPSERAEPDAVTDAPTTHGTSAEMRAHLAAAQPLGEFRCLSSTMTIPLAAFNDDFCDCQDGSDEPGTAACAGHALARFECAPVAGLPAQTLPSSRVRDGVCDCCDGSDERAFRGPRLVSCPNSCEASRAAREADHVALLRGLRARARAVEEARLLRAQRGAWHVELDGGSDDAFLPLALRCFEHEGSSSSLFRVCPYRNATQHQIRAGAWLQGSSRAGARIAVLGLGSAWVERDSVMRMANGDACPNRVRRSVSIEFECAEQSRVVSVAEGQTCVYSVRFGTPAACRPNSLSSPV